MSSVRPITSNTIATSISKKEFDSAQQYSSRLPQSLSNGHVAFFYSAGINYFDILDPVDEKIVRIEIEAKYEWDKNPRAAFLVEDKWLLVVLDLDHYLILDKQKNYLITHQGHEQEFREHRDIVHLRFLEKLLPLGVSQFTAATDPDFHGMQHNFVLCEVKSSGVVILDKLKISFPKMRWRQNYSVLSLDEIGLVLEEADGKKQFYLLKVAANKLIQSKPIDFALKDSPGIIKIMLIKKISAHDVAICSHHLLQPNLLKCNLNLKEARQLPEYDSTLTLSGINYGFIPKSNFIIFSNHINKTQTLRLYDVVNNVIHNTQVDASKINFVNTKVFFDNGQILIMQKNGTMQLFRLRSREEILNLFYPTQEPSSKLTIASLTLNDAFPLSMDVGKIVLDYCGYDFGHDILVEVPTPRTALESAPEASVKAVAESKNTPSLVEQPISQESTSVHVSPKVESDDKHNSDDRTTKISIESKPAPGVFSVLSAESKPSTSASPSVMQLFSKSSRIWDDDNMSLCEEDDDDENEVDIKPQIWSTQEQVARADKAAKMLRDGYISWYKLSFFGHHHNDKAIAVSETISNQPNQAINIIEHQIKLFDGQDVKPIKGIVDKRCSDLINKPPAIRTKAGFYNLLLKMRDELNGKASNQTEEKKSIFCCLPW